MFIGCLAIAAAAAVLAAVTSRAEDWQPLNLVLVLLAFEVASELLAIRHVTPQHAPWAVTSAAPVVLSMTLLGPAPAFAIGVIGLIAGAIHDRTRPIDQAGNLANYATFLVTGGLLSRWVIEAWGLAPDEIWFGLLVVGIYVYADLVSFILNATHGLLVNGESVGDQWRTESDRFMGPQGAIALLTAGAAYAYGTVGLGALGFLAVVQLTHQQLSRSLTISQERAEALQEQAKRLSELSASRGRLVGQVLQAEETERRRLAEGLHDEALQDLLSARQALAAMDGDDPRSERARESIGRATAQLRGAIFDLHPAVLEHSGLAPALRAVANHQAHNAGFDVTVQVDPEAIGPHDRLLFVLGREQLANVAKHAGATEVSLVVSRNDGKVEMQVTDNGCGIDSERRRVAVEHGHIGLASSAERVEALGGNLEIDSKPGAGTRIHTTLPLEGD